MKWNTVVLLCCVWLTNGNTDETSTESLQPRERNCLTHRLNDFNYRLLLKQLDLQGEQNVIVGSASLIGLLGMTLLGTVGDSYEELADLLGFSQDISVNRENHEQLGAALHAGRASSVSAGAVLVSDGAPLRGRYQDFLQRVYEGDVLRANFQDKNETLNLVNEWVDIHTLGKVKHFLDSPLPTDSKAVLLSAFYFKAQWEYPFMPEYSKRLKFYKSNENVLVDYMVQGRRFEYYYSDYNDCHIIKLPYKLSNSSMYLLMPRIPRRLTLSDLLYNLQWRDIEHFIDLMQPTSTVLRMPKMTINSRSELRTPLLNMGVTSIFNATRANFALMFDSSPGLASRFGDIDELDTRINDNELRDLLSKLPSPGVYVDSLLHHVQITVDEFGTEAVGVSAATLAKTAVPFYADTPFFMFIRDDCTGLVTFSSLVYDPSNVDSEMFQS